MRALHPPAVGPGQRDALLEHGHRGGSAAGGVARVAAPAWRPGSRGARRGGLRAEAAERQRGAARAMPPSGAPW
eukprot:6370673-Alexandrium_andersonii.AAC.1